MHKMLHLAQQSAKAPASAALPAAAQLVAMHAAINVGYAKESWKSQDAVMGDVSKIDFQQVFQEAASKLNMDLMSKLDQILILKRSSLLKLMATRAMKEVEEQTDLLVADRINGDNCNNQCSNHHQSQHSCDMEWKRARTPGGCDCFGQEQHLWLLPLREDFPCSSKQLWCFTQDHY